MRGSLGVIALVGLGGACAVARSTDQPISVTRQALDTPVLAAAFTVPAGVSNPGIQGRKPVYAKVGGKVVFVGTDSAHGTELWTTDGTPGGTKLLRDIDPGPQSAFGVQNYPIVPSADGSVGVFVANDGARGAEPWRTDGTTAGTFPLADLVAGVASLQYYEVARAGSSIFIAGETDTGYVLAKTDGTVAGTSTVATVTATKLAGAANGELYFLGTSGLWKSDGTPGGTVRVCPACASIYISHLTTVGNNVFFSSGDFGHAGELWVSDGTPAGTQKLLTNSSGPDELVAVGNKLYFTDFNTSTGSSAYELWASDGTPAGTAFISAVSKPPLIGGNSTVTLDTITPVGSKVFFRGDDLTHGIELWTSDGTGPGTMMVKDISTVSGGALHYSSGPVAFGNGVIFDADDGVTGDEPWYSDGTPAGTVQLKDIVAGASGSSTESFFVDGATAYFQAQQGLWTTTGVGGTTAQVLPAAKTISPPIATAPLGDRLFFAVDDGASGVEPWLTDGTKAGTTKLIDLGPGNLPGNITTAIAFDGAVVFDGFNSALTGTTLYRTDGTVPGTVAVQSNSGAITQPLHLTVLGDRLFFAAGTGAYNAWVYTTANGATSLASGTNARDFTLLGDKVVFASDAALNVTDGTTVTQLVGSIVVDPKPVTFHDHVYFTNFDTPHSIELWSTDGTPGGTALFADLNPNAPSSNPTQLTVVGDTLFFAANGASAQGAELWKSDGTVAGTVLVKDINPGKGSSNPHRLASQDGKLVFYADDGTGLHVFVSDGTDAGTIMLTDATPSTSEKISGPAFEPRLWSTLPGAPMFFPAAKDEGAEWWTSDGTPAGTHLWADLSDGPTSSDPQSPTFVGNRLFFTGFQNGSPAVWATPFDGPIPDAGAGGSTSGNGGSSSSSSGVGSSSSGTSGVTKPGSSSGANDGGANAAAPSSNSNGSSGCGCRTTPDRSKWSGNLAVFALVLVLHAARRRVRA
jgi:MYXO-CTERM domain-containing protein